MATAALQQDLFYTLLHCWLHETSLSLLFKEHLIYV